MDVVVRSRAALCVPVFVALVAAPLTAQPYGEPDRDSPGDAMIQAWLAARAKAIDAEFLAEIESATDWTAARPRYLEEYRSMLGLPRERVSTPLHATVTGRVEGDGYVVELLHYQSRPRLYVTANLYRPAVVEPGSRLPAILYVCGHSPRGRNGNKTAYQSWGIWFARHGYVCLMVDTLQLGEIAAIHHGTYREERWWWHSRGYTSAGVECLNGIRGIDYLVSRADVDPERIGVTGISGGGAATFWVAAADERVKVAAPVSGMADLESYVGNRVINGHCDCMFLHNTHRWPWTRIAAMIAPRPLLFVNSDADPIFPMDANERVIARLERLYALFGAGDLVDSVVSIGGHAYRTDIRRAVYRFLNLHLKDDSRPVTDSEVDLVTGNDHPIPPERLRVFRTDADIPADELNTKIDAHFVELASPDQPLPESLDAFRRWQSERLERLRAIDRRREPGRTLARLEGERLETEPGVGVVLRRLRVAPEKKRHILVVGSSLDADLDWLGDEVGDDAEVWLVEPRGIGSTRWTRNNPPNYVERSHVLVGTTVDASRLLDVFAAIDAIELRLPIQPPITVAGRGSNGLLAAYAAALSRTIDRVVVADIPLSHRASGAPQFLDSLRVGDVPEILGLIAPRPLVVHDGNETEFARTIELYTAAGARDRIGIR